MIPRILSKFHIFLGNISRIINDFNHIYLYIPHDQVVYFYLLLNNIF